MNQSELISPPSPKPLYEQVKRLLIERLAAGDWGPGELLPSEAALAQIYGVSQGTVRKAVDAMAAERLVVRHQGRGTEVAKHDSERSLFQFWHLYSDNGDRQMPTSDTLKCVRRTAPAREAKLLGIERGVAVVSINRCRYVDNLPVLIEWITLPAERFPGIERYGDELPNTLYALYQKKYQVTIQSAVENLQAVASDSRDERHLNVKLGTPLLEIQRVALDLENTPVELRISRCNTEHLHYRNVLD